VLRCEADALCIALRTALVPPVAGTFRPWERRHEASWDEDPPPLLLLGDAVPVAPPPDEPHAETAASMSTVPATIRLPCRLVINLLPPHCSAGAARLRPAPADEFTARPVKPASTVAEGSGGRRARS
jgi:hypothetical protein